MLPFRAACALALAAPAVAKPATAAVAETDPVGLGRMAGAPPRSCGRCASTTA